MNPGLIGKREPKLGCLLADFCFGAHQEGGDMGDGAAVLNPVAKENRSFFDHSLACRAQAVRSYDPTQLARLVVGERVSGCQEARERHGDTPVFFPREGFGEKLRESSGL